MKPALTKATIIFLIGMASCIRPPAAMAKSIPTATPLATTLPAATATPEGPLAVVRFATINVRAGPGTQHAVVAVVKQGHKLSIIGLNSDASWLEISLQDGQRGWVATSLTRLDALATSLALTAKIPAPPPELGDRQKEILLLINKQRAEYGLPALGWSPELARAAQAHAEDCAQRNSGSHIGSDGALLRTRLARAGYAATWSSEIWANARNGQQAFARWWNEPPGDDPHRRNILSPQYKELGIGVAAGSWGYYFIVDFGSR